MKSDEEMLAEMREKYRKQQERNAKRVRYPCGSVRMCNQLVYATSEHVRLGLIPLCENCSAKRIKLLELKTGKKLSAKDKKVIIDLERTKKLSDEEIANEIESEWDRINLNKGSSGVRYW